MSPPIYTPDGSEVSEIVLPDGSTASQVVDPDGNVVFEAGPDIPDSLVSRPDDNSTQSNNADMGIVFETSRVWPDFQARISQNQGFASDEEMVIREGTSGSDIAVVDVSANSPLDVITFDSIGLQANTEYSVFMRTPSGESRDRGINDSTNYPILSDDGNLVMTGEFFDGETGFGNNTSNSILEIGNINL
jgi:hypothetical protein